MGCSCSEPKQDQLLEKAASQTTNITKSNSSSNSLKHQNTKDINDQISNEKIAKGNVAVYKNGMKQNTEKKIVKTGGQYLKEEKSIKEVLENDILKEKALNLCKEHEELSAKGEDSGFITFIQKYLSQKMMDQLFTKCGITDDEITDLDELKSMLAISIILYKAQVTKIKNLVFDGVNVNKTRFQKSDIKPIAKYISCWIMNRYGNWNKVDDEDDEFYIAKEEYCDKMSDYLRDFVRFEWTSFSSMMSIDITKELSKLESLDEQCTNK